jgi:hypothetical protein
MFNSKIIYKKNMELNLLFTILSIVAFIGLCAYVIYNLLVKVERYEDIIQTQDTILSTLKEQILKASIKLKEHDTRGHYNSEDDLGTYFKTLLEVDRVLSEYIEESTTDEKT